MSNSEIPSSSLQWLNAFPRHDWYFEISTSRTSAVPKGDYDNQYALDPGDLDVGKGVLSMLKERGCDFAGPALEIGCGTGGLTLGLVASRAFPTIIVTDPSVEFLDITRRRIEQLPQGESGDLYFATLSGEQLEFLPENSVSLIILHSVRHQLLDPEEFLATTARALRPGGVFVCVEPCEDGNLVMRLMARFIPRVLEQEGESMNREQTGKLRSYCDSLEVHLRHDSKNPADISQDEGGLAFHGVFMWSKHELEKLQSNRDERLRIVTLNTYDTHGGAARAAWRLHSGLRRIGQQSQMLVMHRSSQDPKVRVAVIDESPEAEAARTRWSQAKIRHIDRRRTRISETYFSPPVPGYDWSLHPSVRRSDIIHLHWVSGMVSPSGVRALMALNKPIVWTLHDQRPFTGGCHFSAGCDRYCLNCSECPQLQCDSSGLPERALRESLEQIDASRITVVCPSEWMEKCVRQSALFRNSRIELIPNGLETEIYTVRDKMKTRLALELPTDGFYFLFGAHSAHDRRKGSHILTAAVRIASRIPVFQAGIEGGKIRFLTYGQDSEQRDYEGMPVISLGFIEDPEKMAMAYAAADVFLCPTLEDNLPNTILEALSCGRPVIASNVGGVPDMVRDGVNGRLVMPGDPQALAEALLQVTDAPEELAAWGEAGRRGIEAGHRLQQQAEQYLNLYQDLLRESMPTPVDLPREQVTLPLLPSVWEFDVPERIPPPDSAGIVSVAETQERVTIKPMENAWTRSDGLSYKPSWKGDSRFINSEHALIWERTNYLPGPLDAAECQKLYEMAYHNGQVILEIGVFAGYGAAVALCGAMVGRTGQPPQYFGVDNDPSFLERSLSSVSQFCVEDRCFFFHGGLQAFVRKMPIVPTMVFLAGVHEYGGMVAELHTLGGFLAPGTPVLCHDYQGNESVRRAVDEAMEGPYFRMVGFFGGSVLLQTTDACQGEVRGLSEEDFQKTRLAFLQLYEKILNPSSGNCKWPYKAPAYGLMPATLPSGRPWPCISIITPSFNQGQYIEQTILSIANQNYPNVEHIVMDGGSTDETVAVLEKYSPLLSYWVSEKDGGQSSAINKGFSKATGEIITWLNSDDLLAPGALAAIALAFDTSGADMVAGICQLHRDGEIFDQHLTTCADGPLPLGELLDLENHWMSGQFFFQPEVFFKRALLLKVGGNVNENAHWSMDFELWVRFAQAGATLKVIGRPIAQFRVHEEQKTQDVIGFKAELQALVDKLRPTLQLPPSPTPITGRKQKLRIVFFNDVGFRYGAGIGHERLARAARLAGHEVVPIAVGTESLTDSERALPFAAQIVPSLKALSPDVVVVGNIHAAGLDPSILKELSDALPTVFLLHDSWLLSGRCAYRGDCTKNLTMCDEACPTADEYPKLDPTLIASAWKKKMDLIQTASKLVLAANSLWTRRQVDAVADARQAPANSPARRPMTVRLSVPLDVFQPLDPASCRRELGFPEDKFILLFSCSNLADKRKGVDHLIEAIRKLNLPDLVPVCIGYSDGSTPLDLPNLISAGYVNDPHKQALLYSAADLLVAPSLEEAFGQVFIEAAACGTPSVAYSVGGVPESLMDGVVGRLAKKIEPEALAEAIKELYLNRRLRLNLGWWGRIHVENEFSLEASSRTLFFVLREAIRLGGYDLVPKLGLRPKPGPLPGVNVLLESLGYIRPSILGAGRLSERQLDLIMLDHYQSQLVQFRRRSTPWWLKPKAWLAKINRDGLRKKVARNERKQKRANNGAE